MVIGKNMNKLVVDIKSLELDTLKNLSNAKAENTLRAYKADYRDFLEFCAKHSFKSYANRTKNSSSLSHSFIKIL